MTNKEIASRLKLTANLMELHDENPFKVKSLANAAFKIGKMDVPLMILSKEELEKIDGIGKSIAGKIIEIRTDGVTKELQELLDKTPSGVVEMLGIKGLGPKKVANIWQQLNCESVGELLYACNENRLVDLKGFGKKTQEEVIKAIEFLQNAKGKFHYYVLEELSNELVEEIKKLDSVVGCSLTGAMRRKMEVIEDLELVVAATDPQIVIEFLRSNNFALLNQSESGAIFKKENGLSLKIGFCKKEEFAFILFESTAEQKHLQDIYEKAGLSREMIKNSSTEEDIFKKLNLPYYVPEIREGIYDTITLNKADQEKLVTEDDLKGILHLHTTYSDGIHTLREMAEYAKEKGYEYIGVCDHSQTAVYANGLKPERIFQQHAEIEKLNNELAPFKIFKGIESDILNDGQLDYHEGVLKTFDFVVASVHSNLKMDKAKATARVIKAIENPYTTILGHPTGRLLLSRNGYELDWEKVFDAAVSNKVVIELNSHPHRLDLDWRLIHRATEKGIMISINPDAHNRSGYHDMHYGVNVARKGLLRADMTFNARSAEEVWMWFKERNK